MKSVRVAIGLAITAALVRLLPLHFLHPLNWDELEFFQATSWIGEGRVPFRDFWEHHTPLAWFVFAPFTWLTDDPGAGAIILLRWAQIPVWMATFWLLHVWMRNAGIDRFARWSATALALSSSLFMTPAVEYRVEALGCALLMAGLVLAQRERYFFAGVAFCLAGLTNLRLGPVLVVAVLSFLVMRRLRAGAIIAGGLTALAAALGYFAATGSLAALYQHVWVDNLAEKFATPVLGGFIHRLLVPFGVRIIGSDRLFELAAVDAGGIAVLLLGVAGFVLSWRRRGGVVLIAILQLANFAFLAMMKFLYNYHFALAVILMVPLIAIVIERIPRRGAVVALLFVAWSVNAFASIFRGKELDRAYQDFILREVHARTRPGEIVFSGVPWGLRREPAYRFWFLPELARQLVRQGLAPRYEVSDPPALVVGDFNALLWMARVQRELAPYFVRHYIPVWRNLWVPALNARIETGRGAEWIVPRDGTYRLFVSPAIGLHRWFREPFNVALYEDDDAASRNTLVLPPPAAHPDLVWTIDGVAASLDAARIVLTKGQRIRVISHATEPLGIILLPGSDTILFRQPPPGATLEAQTTRVTHIPDIGVRIEP